MIRRRDRRGRHRQRPGLIGDVLNGAVRGDFAPELGLAGALTQVVLGFVPVVGTMAALRDFFADWRHHDRLGTLLNALAVIPLAGGFAKTADVLHNLHHVNQVWRALHRPSQ